MFHSHDIMPPGNEPKERNLFLDVIQQKEKILTIRHGAKPKWVVFAWKWYKKGLLSYFSPITQPKTSDTSRLWTVVSRKKTRAVSDSVWLISITRVRYVSLSSWGYFVLRRNVSFEIVRARMSTCRHHWSGYVMCCVATSLSKILILILMAVRPASCYVDYRTFTICIKFLLSFLSCCRVAPFVFSSRVI